MPYVLHMTALNVWSYGGGDIEPESLGVDGFVHASPDETTLITVANAFYSGVTETQAVLVIDTTRLAVEVRWDTPSPVPPPGVASDVLFPHIYGPIPRDSVVEVRTLHRDLRGTFTHSTPISATQP